MIVGTTKAATTSFHDQSLDQAIADLAQVGVTLVHDRLLNSLDLADDPSRLVHDLLAAVDGVCLLGGVKGVIATRLDGPTQLIELALRKLCKLIDRLNKLGRYALGSLQLFQRLGKRLDSILVAFEKSLGPGKQKPALAGFRITQAGENNRWSRA